MVTQKAPLLLDYKGEEDTSLYTVGRRVLVPYRRQICVGIVVACQEKSTVAYNKLRHVEGLLDSVAMLDDATLESVAWLSAYYHESQAKILQAMLPSFFWDQAAIVPPSFYQEGCAPAQHRLSKSTQKILSLLRAYGRLSQNQLRQHAIPQKTIAAAIEQGMIKQVKDPSEPVVISPPTLSDAQQSVVSAILDKPQELLQYVYGVTGSGKTHVYLAIVARWTQNGGQVLWLLPEIGLTPQLIDFLGSVLDRHRVAVLHSGLTKAQKERVKAMALSGEISLLVGTRSAVFTPCKDLRGIILDEEHDSSYKQLSGWRYSARGIACMRAKKNGIPIILGSATPSLSCLYQAQVNNTPWHTLTGRFNKAVLPRVVLVKQEKGQTKHGFMTASLQELDNTLKLGKKVLIFINRRGFAQVLWCESCHAIQQCLDCDKAYTFHQVDNTMRCHRCGVQHPFCCTCQKCDAECVVPLGQGTEKISRFMQEKYPLTEVVQMDRDTCPTWKTLQEKLAIIRQPKPQILVATQMLVKSHNIPNLGLVIVLEADNALFSKDFRAQEHLLQQMHQVAGRAGRDGGDSQVIIQTFHVDHPIWNSVQQHNYLQYAHTLLAERKKHQLPPYSHQALVGLSGPDQRSLFVWAEKIQAGIVAKNVLLYPPIPSMIAKQAKMYRVVFLLQSQQARALHQVLQTIQNRLNNTRMSNNMQWNMDIDPIDW